ncbi:MAG: DNA ligase D [Hyphomicrobiaceae bacterium]
MSPKVDSLDDYAAKRDFGRTPEPPPGKRKRLGRRFVIQKHHARRLHFDLRLEFEGVLVSWAVPKGLSLDPSQKRLAVRTENHPLDYSDFEGQIPEKQYGAGLVEIWDRGTWAPLQQTHPCENLEDGHLKFWLDGERINAGFALVRLDKKAREENWLLIKEKDAAATSSFEPSDVWLGSVGPLHSKRPGPPKFIEPQLARLTDAPPSGPRWIHEIKYDGYRLQAIKDGEQVCLCTRNGKDLTSNLPAIAQSVRNLPRSRVILDGEIVVFDGKGVSDFQALQKDLKSGSRRVVFVVFDCLRIDDRDLRAKQLEIRKGELRALLSTARPPVKYCDHILDDGRAFFDAVTANGGEGILSKHLDRPWQSGRNRHWLKIKGERRGVFVVVGYTKSGVRALGALLLGSFDGQECVYRGRVGTGFSDREAAKILTLLSDAETRRPTIDPVPKSLPASIRWVNLRYYVKVAYADVTVSGRLRHPRYIKLVSIAKPARRKHIKLTNPQRLLFPDKGYTKSDLDAYLQAVADPLLSELTERFVSLVRAPDGDLTRAFYQRHSTRGMPAAIRRFKTSAAKHYISIADREGLSAAAQFSVIEFHIWQTRIETPEYPDRLVFDLDPGDDLPFSAVRNSAELVRDVLDAAALKSYCLLTGGKGIHVVVPLDETRDIKSVSGFAEMIARRLARAEPHRFVATSSKAKRRGKIYIDWLRNKGGATAIAPWSPRAKTGGTVAMPIRWAELSRARSASDYDLERARRRLSSLKSDPWKGYFGIQQNVPTG